MEDTPEKADKPGLIGVGVGVEEITPLPEMAARPGDAITTVDAHGVGSPSHAKALALKGGAQPILWITCDSVGFGDPLAQRVRQRLHEDTGVPFRHVLLSTTHTHSGGSLAEERYSSFVQDRIVSAARAALSDLEPCRVRIGHTFVVGASFNTRVPLPNGKVWFTRDYREGLSSGRPIDPRMNLVEFTDSANHPKALLVGFAAHPACVITGGPISAEYPGYMTDYLTAEILVGAPAIFAYKASGDVNCVPMFGSEKDSQHLGVQLAKQAAAVLETLQPCESADLALQTRTIHLPLVEAPSAEELRVQIKDAETFINDLDRDPSLVWVMGINCPPHWPAAQKKRYARPPLEWAKQALKRVGDGIPFPSTWTAEITAMRLGDVGIVFCPGEPFVEVGLAVESRSPFAETLVLAVTNGGTVGYLPTDADLRRGGYEPNSCKFGPLREGRRPLPYAPGAADVFIDAAVGMLKSLR